MQAKHEQQLLEDFFCAKREKGELVGRLTPFRASVAEDTDCLTPLLDVSTLAAMNAGNAALSLAAPPKRATAAREKLPVRCLALLRRQRSALLSAALHVTVYIPSVATDLTSARVAHRLCVLR
jgi:hypothetical protein